MERRSTARVDLGVIWSFAIGDHTVRPLSALPPVPEATFLEAEERAVSDSLPLRRITSAVFTWTCCPQCGVNFERNFRVERSEMAGASHPRKADPS